MLPDERRSAWSPLRLPIYRSLWVTALFSNIGSWMHDIAAAWLMTGLAPSPLFVSLLQTAASLPMFLLALPCGALADILDRRRLLLGTISGLILGIGVMGTLTMVGWMSPWMLLVFTFLLGIGHALFSPAIDALTPEVVESEDLPQAVALDSVGLNVARAIGGGLGGLLTGVLGSGPVFLLNAGLTIPNAVAILRSKALSIRSSLPPESVSGAVKAGLRYLRFSPALRSVLVRAAGFIVPGCALWSLLPLVARNEMKLSSAAYGLLVGFFGVGALIGALGLPAIRSRLGPDKLMAGATVLLAGVLVSLASVRVFAGLAVTMGLAGAAWLALMSTLNTALQSSIPSWVRARGSALQGLTLMGGTAAGSTLWGILATEKGVDVALFSAGGLAVAGLLLGFRYSLPRGEPDLTPSQHWPAPSLAGSSTSLNDPVEVIIEYRIDPKNAAEFRRELEALRDVRRRDGADEWKLEVDPVDPSHFIEVFRLSSWTEHLRQHERVTVADRELEGRVRAYHQGGRPPVVSHRSLGLRPAGQGRGASL